MTTIIIKVLTCICVSHYWSWIIMMLIVFMVLFLSEINIILKTLSPLNVEPMVKMGKYTHNTYTKLLFWTLVPSRSFGNEMRVGMKDFCYVMFSFISTFHFDCCLALQKKFIKSKFTNNSSLRTETTVSHVMIHEKWQFERMQCGANKLLLYIEN